jgi:hypothetical protein
VPRLFADSSTSAQWLINGASILAALGLSNLVIFLFRRKGELVALDRTSSSPLLESQGAFIDRLARAETVALERVRSLEGEMVSRDHEFAQQLQRCNALTARLTATVTGLRVELDLVTLELNELRHRLKLEPRQPTTHIPPTTPTTPPAP